MNSIRFTQKLGHYFAAGIICMSLAVAVNAQVETQTSVTDGQATKIAKIERGEVVYVSGHDLIVKKDDGKIVHFANVPDSARAMVDGKELGIHDLKPGMKLQRTTITTTTPRTVTTTQSVTGKVWYASPPNYVILTLADGTNHKFNIPAGQKITVNGKLTDAWGLKKGMIVSATRVVEAPETVISRQTRVTGTVPPAAVAPPSDEPILFAWFVPPAPVLAGDPPAELPETGSLLPLLGLLGMVTVGLSLGLRFTRTNA
ncbi:MAG TPA: hypothetical protein VMU61_13990 [Candidatus Aquilonibacter sp.]|nr:hypothetical protein [Candidatus Aquilonibacter sp.]